MSLSLTHGGGGGNDPWAFITVTMPRKRSLLLGCGRRPRDSAADRLHAPPAVRAAQGFAAPIACAPTTRTMTTEAEPPQSARGQTTGRLAATAYGGPK